MYFLFQEASRGVAYIVIELNTPPHSGSCVVSPTEGTPFDTKFNFTCAGWTDDGSVTEYQFFGEYQYMKINKGKGEHCRDHNSGLIWENTMHFSSPTVLAWTIRPNALSSECNRHKDAKNAKNC